jgi:hypothetical protein
MNDQLVGMVSALALKRAESEGWGMARHVLLIEM